MNQKQFMEAKKQLEEERRTTAETIVQELEELINGEKEILMKKNIPVEQMLKYLGYEKLTRGDAGRSMCREYMCMMMGRVEVEWKSLDLICSNNVTSTTT